MIKEDVGASFFLRCVIETQRQNKMNMMPRICELGKLSLNVGLELLAVIKGIYTVLVRKTLQEIFQSPQRAFSLFSID